MCDKKNWKRTCLTKPCTCNIQRFLKLWKSKKNMLNNFDIFLLFPPQNIDCGCAYCTLVPFKKWATMKLWRFLGNKPQRTDFHVVCKAKTQYHRKKLLCRYYRRNLQFLIAAKLLWYCIVNSNLILFKKRIMVSSIISMWPSFSKMEMHREILRQLCRLCGNGLTKDSRDKNELRNKVQQVCGIYFDNDDVCTHPPRVCDTCRRKLQHFYKEKLI